MTQTNSAARRSSTELPVIDLGGRVSEPSTAVVSAVADAAARYGFLQVVAHGIADDHIDELWSSARAFFAQSADKKRQIMLWSSIPAT